MKALAAKQQMIEHLLHRQQFIPETLDYDTLEKKKLLLEEIATISNNGISLFDMCSKQHIFYSSNYAMLLGYSSAEIVRDHPHFMQDKIHPDDANVLADNGISLLKLFYSFSTEEKTSYKFINEYRVLKADQTYVRVIEQDQILALDPSGNMWLSLGILGIAPNQLPNEGLKSQVVNFRTGTIIPMPKETVHQRTVAELTPRELEILKMIREGLLSKEISGKLAISLHTVNTHRQRILEKLKANNSLEAVALASNLGMI
jgi:DNA-binding CsgD family transcriptional regulator